MSDTSTETAESENSAGTASDSQPTQADIEKLTAAMAKERDLRKEAERQAKNNSEAAKRLADMEAANASDLEKAVKAARDEGKAEAISTANARLVRAEARAVAAHLGFEDPTDAVALVDLTDIKVDDDGEVDADAIKGLLTDLADKKKYLIRAKADTSSTDAGIGTAGTAAADGSAQGLIRAGLTRTSKTK